MVIGLGVRSVGRRGAPAFFVAALLRPHVSQSLGRRNARCAVSGTTWHISVSCVLDVCTDYRCLCTYLYHSNGRAQDVAQTGAQSSNGVPRANVRLAT